MIFGNRPPKNSISILNILSETISALRYTCGAFKEYALGLPTIPEPENASGRSSTWWCRRCDRKWTCRPQDSRWTCRYCGDVLFMGGKPKSRIPRQDEP